MAALGEKVRAQAADRINRGVFSSNTEMWSTPQRLFDALDAEFGFTLDPCATPDNAKCDRYFTIDDDGLAQPWDGVVFMNPPYGRGIGDWVAKAHKEALNGTTVVCLIPARTDTAWWHDHAMQADEIRLIRGRLHFGGDHERTAHNAPFPSALVIFRSGHQPCRVFYPRLTSGDRDDPRTAIDRLWDRLATQREAASAPSPDSGSFVEPRDA